MNNDVVKFGLDGAIDIANKYLEQDNKITNVSNEKEVFFESFSGSRRGKRDKSKGLLTLKNGQKIEVEEGSLLYEKLVELAKREMIMVGLDHFINPTMIAEWEDIDRSIDYSMKDVVKEEEIQDTSWKDVFGDVERS